MESMTQMRVELIRNPELQGLTKFDIERFRNEYALYKEKVEAQGEGAKAVSKYHCIPVHIRKSIALQIGVKSSALTREQVFLKINELDTKNPGRKDAVEASQVFKGLRMEAPKRQADIPRKIQDFFSKIQRRVELHGVEDLLYDNDKLEFRKQSFPSIINGIWPENLCIGIKQEWLNASRKWSMRELLEIIERKVNEVGTYELDRVRQQRSGSTGIGNDANRVKTMRVDKRESVTHVKNSFPDRKGEAGEKNKRIKCYNCGKIGHIQSTCFLKSNDPVAIKGRKELQQDNRKRLKVLQEKIDYLIQESEEVEEEVEEETLNMDPEISSD
jgi:Zinc knuckle